MAWKFQIDFVLPCLLACLYNRLLAYLFACLLVWLIGNRKRKGFYVFMFFFPMMTAAFHRYSFIQSFIHSFIHFFILTSYSIFRFLLILHSRLFFFSRIKKSTEDRSSSASIHAAVVPTTKQRNSSSAVSRLSITDLPTDSFRIAARWKKIYISHFG